MVLLPSANIFIIKKYSGMVFIPEGDKYNWDSVFSLFLYKNRILHFFRKTIFPQRQVILK